MRFLVDAQLPPALAQFLRGRGHEASHVGDVGLLGAKDPAIWEYSDENGCVIIAKDEDFAVMRMIRTSGPKGVWLRIGNSSNRALLQ